MQYTIYKITNKVNGKIYIGKHQTQDINDDYMGSGKHLKRAIEKYGIENFQKEILHIFDNEEDMNAKESELVTEEFVKNDSNYNLCPGGKGGWGYINFNMLYDERVKRSKSGRKKANKTLIKKYGSIENYVKEIVQPAGRDAWKKKFEENDNSRWYYSKGTLGYKHTVETKQKMSISKKGENNPQYGTMWITNGSENRKIKKTDNIPDGWYRGRKKA